MRSIRIVPGVTSFWLMNPGVILYYDKIFISQDDFDSVYINKNKSSFHAYAYLFFDSIIKKYPQIFCIDKYNVNIDIYDKKSIEIIDFLFKNSNNNKNFTPKKILDITIRKYKKWILFNEAKCSFLLKNEDYRNSLYEIHIPKWNQYLKQIIKLKSFINKKDFYDRFCDIPSAIGSFTRLISRSLEIMDLSKQNIPIYDCMIDDYIDGINITEQALSVIYNRPEKGKINFYLTNKACKQKHKFISYTTMHTFFENIEKYEAIRKDLIELDAIINNLEKKDIIDTTKINKEILSILKKLKSQHMDYAIWIMCFFPMFSYIFSPHVTPKIKNLVFDYYIHQKKYGDIFSPYIKIYGTLLKIADQELSITTKYDPHDLNERYDFYRNIIKNRQKKI